MSKKLNLKNYTSETPASKSITKIEEVLVLNGATKIQKDYEDGILRSISFVIDYNGTRLPVKLPARVDKVQEVFWSQVKKPQSSTAERIRVQAERTAWKIVADWVAIQMSMIQLEQAEFVEIFMPYIYDGKKKMTFFQQVKKDGMKLLPKA